MMTHQGHINSSPGDPNLRDCIDVDDGGGCGNTEVGNHLQARGRGRLMLAYGARHRGLLPNMGHIRRGHTNLFKGIGWEGDDLSKHGRCRRSGLFAYARHERRSMLEWAGHRCGRGRRHRRGHGCGRGRGRGRGCGCGRGRRHGHGHRCRCRRGRGRGGLFEQVGRVHGDQSESVRCVRCDRSKSVRVGHRHRRDDLSKSVGRRRGCSDWSRSVGCGSGNGHSLERGTRAVRGGARDKLRQAGGRSLGRRRKGRGSDGETGRRGWEDARHSLWLRFLGNQHECGVDTEFSA